MSSRTCRSSTAARCARTSSSPSRPWKGSRRYPYQIVHIASHGQFDSDVNKTFLLTYDGKIGMNKLEQILGLSKFRTDAVELLR